MSEKHRAQNLQMHPVIYKGGMATGIWGGNNNRNIKKWVVRDLPSRLAARCIDEGSRMPPPPRTPPSSLEKHDVDDAPFDAGVCARVVEEGVRP